MKFLVHLKDSDGFYESVQEAAKQAASKIVGLENDERKYIEERRAETINGFLNKWVEYGEYVTLEFDTDANTATVVFRNQ